MAHLDNPAARLLVGMPPFCLRLLASIHDMGDVAVPLDDSPQLRAAVSGIGTQMLAAALGGHGTRDRDRLEHLLQALAISHVGRGHDDRQRDATPVHQQVTLAPIFSPGPSGWVQRILVPSVP